VQSAAAYESINVTYPRWYIHRNAVCVRSFVAPAGLIQLHQMYVTYYISAVVTLRAMKISPSNLSRNREIVYDVICQLTLVLPRSVYIRDNVNVSTNNRR